MPHVDEGALHAYLDGELAPAERSALDAHVAECAACRARLVEERALIERAGQLLGRARPLERPAPPLHQLRKPRLVWRLRIPVAWAASVVLALVVGYNLRTTTIPQSAGSTDAISNAAEPSQDQPAPPEPRQQRPRATQPEANRLAREQDTAPATKVAPAPAAGMIAIRPPPPARAATPEPVADARPDTNARANILLQESITVSGLRGRLLATEWPIIRRGSARDLLGSEPVGVPGLPIRDIRRSPEGDGTVLVQQVIDSNTVIQVFQQSATAARRDELAAAGEARRMSKATAAERLARFVGGLRVEISGPLSQDSLNRLLESVRALP